MPEPPPIPSNPSPGLSPEHRAQIVAARRLSGKLRAAAAVAAVDGWTLGVFAVLTILFSLTSPVALALGAGMLAVSYFELRGARDLKRLDPRAPRLLTLNQFALGAMLFVYGAINLWLSLHEAHPMASMAGQNPELESMLLPYEGLVRNISALFYAMVMLVALVEPGLMALYYHRRGKVLQAYLQTTPQWILELQRAGMSV